MSIDPNAPKFLLKLLSNLGGMKQVREAVSLYDIDYARAIEEKERYGESGQPLAGAAQDEEDEDRVDEVEDEDEDEFFPELPVINPKVKTFFRGFGWFEGTVVDMCDRGVNVVFTDNEKETWTKEEYDANALDAKILVGSVGYRFVKGYKCGSGEMGRFTGTVVEILRSKNRRCEFCDGETKDLSIGQLKIASQYQPPESQEQIANQEDAMSLALSGDDEGDKGGDSGDDISVEEKAPTGKYFNQLIVQWARHGMHLIKRCNTLLVLLPRVLDK